MGRTTKILNISIEPKLYEEINETAKTESRTKSELIREAFRQYQSNKSWTQIRKWGNETATKMSIKDEEDIDRILHE
ncbi:MAG: ribbon-helix-helix domain-containing protein [Candidatus Humimicrobiaceae bacterium]